MKMLVHIYLNINIFNWKLPQLYSLEIYLAYVSFEDTLTLLHAFVDHDLSQKVLKVNDVAQGSWWAQTRETFQQPAELQMKDEV